MIHFDPVPEPSDFDVKARVPGVIWLREHPSEKRPRDYWSAFKPQLADGFRNLCGYGAMYEPVGTIDHYVDCREDSSQAYEWNNYRFASQWINSSKQDRKPGQMQVLDPFEIEDGWFEITMPSLQLIATDRIPKELRARAEDTLDRLHLRHDERVLRQRRKWYEEYLKTGDLEMLRRNAPLLARAIDKQRGQLSTAET